MVAKHIVVYLNNSFKLKFKLKFKELLELHGI